MGMNKEKYLVEEIHHKAGSMLVATLMGKIFALTPPAAFLYRISWVIGQSLMVTILCLTM